jgi:hypothetical protein
MFPLPQFYKMAVCLIPTAAVVALEESTTQMGFGGGDGWAMSQDYAMYVLSRPFPRAGGRTERCLANRQVSIVR